MRRQAGGQGPVAAPKAPSVGRKPGSRLVPARGPERGPAAAEGPGAGGPACGRAGARNWVRIGGLAAGLGLLLSAVWTPATHAATPQAWAALFRTAQAACETASGLTQPKLVGAPVDFTTHVLVIVTGTWPQPHMKGASGRFACLFEKARGTAEAQEFPVPSR